MPKITSIDKTTDILFLVFYFTGEVKGVTKIQKLLYLLKQHGDLIGLRKSLQSLHHSLDNFLGLKLFLFKFPYIAKEAPNHYPPKPLVFHILD